MSSMGSMTTAMLSVKRTRRATAGIVGAFFIQGFLGVAWLPRIPEIIDNLGVSFSTWGLIMGLAGLGSIAPLLFASKLINRWGTRPLIQLSFLLAATAVCSFGFITNPLFFFLAVFAQNFGYGIYNVAINSHSVVFQNRIGRVILGRFHASWSIGAAGASILTGLLAASVPLGIYLVGAAVSAVVLCLVGTGFMLGPREDGHEQEKKRAEPVPLLKTPGYVLLLAMGLLCAVLPEVSVMEWGAVFAKRGLDLPTALQGIPYTFFVTAMIVSRLSIGRLSRRRHLSRVGQIAGILGGVSMTIAVVLGSVLAGIDPVLALAVTAIFWGFMGLGSGPQVPAFFSVTGSVDGMTTAQVMSRMSLVNSLLILIAKIAMGGIAQLAGVPFVFALPVVAYIGAVLISGYVIKRQREKSLDAAEPVVSNDELEAFEAFPVTSPVGVVTTDD